MASSQNGEEGLYSFGGTRLTNDVSGELGRGGAEREGEGGAGRSREEQGGAGRSREEQGGEGRSGEERGGAGCKGYRGGARRSREEESREGRTAGGEAREVKGDEHTMRVHGLVKKLFFQC
jgi:hypothetical protein